MGCFSAAKAGDTNDDALVTPKEDEEQTFHGRRGLFQSIQCVEFVTTARLTNHANAVGPEANLDLYL